MLDTSAVATAATATNTAVQAPWTDSALSEVDNESIPAPPTKIMTVISVLKRESVGKHTEPVDHGEDFFAYPASEEVSHIIDTV